MRVCTLCNSPRREEIDRAIIDGGSVRDIAGRFRGVSKSAVDRHRPHIGELIQAHKSEQAETVAGDLSRSEDRVESLYSAAQSVLNDALKQRNAAGVLASVKTACRVLEQARSLAELRQAQEAAQVYVPQDIDRQLEQLFAASNAKLRAELEVELRQQIRAELLAEIQSGGLVVQ